MIRLEVRRMLELEPESMLGTDIPGSALQGLAGRVTSGDGRVLEGVLDLRSFAPRIVASDGCWTWADRIDAQPGAIKHWPVEVLTLAALAAAGVIADLADDPEEVRRLVIDRLTESSDADMCPACGDVIDYCMGHGEIGDPAGAAILDAHDDGDHARCHAASPCRSS